MRATIWTWMSQRKDFHKVVQDIYDLIVTLGQNPEEVYPYDEWNGDTHKQIESVASNAFHMATIPANHLPSDHHDYGLDEVGIVFRLIRQSISNHMHLNNLTPSMPEISNYLKDHGLNCICEQCDMDKHRDRPQRDGDDPQFYEE